MTFRKALALILILAILCAGAYYLLRTEQADNERMRNLYAQAEPLERQRAALIEERDSLKGNYSLKFRDYATTEILFTELDSQILSEAYPIMRDHGVVGVLGFSYREFPIYYNKLTPADCLRLIGDGWGTCLIYEQGWGSFTAWYQALVNSLSNYRITPPTSVYFPNETFYKEEMLSELIECGIRTVIFNAADGRSNTVTDVTGPVWFTGAMPWNYTGSAVDTQLLGRTDGANLCYTMKFSEKWSDPKVESQEKASFISVLDDWKDMIYSESPLDELDSVAPTPSIYIDPNDKDQVSATMKQMYLDALTPEQRLLLPRFRSTNFESALQYHLDALSNNGVMQSELDERTAALDAQIAELDTQIRAVYDYWGNTQSGTDIIGQLFGGKS